ncbi:DUF5641 domain-containing protein [Trichonephila clavipes]|nr:DUF5641 domain-containing protein [Trichonephila clavipes]
MFLIENRCSDTTDIDELNSRDLRKRMKYRIKLLSDLRQRCRREYLSELIQKQNDNRVREPRIGEMVLIGNDNKKRLSWPIAKIIELIPGQDGEIRTVRLKTQHGTVIRPVQRIFPLEVQAIANSDKELKEESISVKSTKLEKVLNTNDAIVKKYTSSGRLVKEPKRLDLLNYNCYRNNMENCLNINKWPTCSFHHFTKTDRGFHQRQFCVNAWSGIVNDLLISPYLLLTRLNGKRYLIFLEHVLAELLQDVPIAICNRMWFQHDGAPAHFSTYVRTYQNATFGMR